MRWVMDSKVRPIYSVVGTLPPLESPYNPRADRSVAGVAQLVEQRIRNAKVVGSNPISGTTISC